MDGRNRSLNCGIGKCGACEMLVDGQVRRICITKVDGVKEVRRIDSGECEVPEVRPQPAREVKWVFSPIDRYYRRWLSLVLVLPVLPAVSS